MHMILNVYRFSLMFTVSYAYLSLVFLDFTIFLHMLVFNKNNNNNSIAFLNLSIISDVLLIVHTCNEHLQGDLIV